jgi:hypothetical protein
MQNVYKNTSKKTIFEPKDSGSFVFQAEFLDVFDNTYGYAHFSIVFRENRIQCVYVFV